LRVVFMGSARFSVPSLALLLQSSHRVVGVVTQPDRPRGRGKRLVPGPVKEYALQAGLPLLQPEDLRARDFLQRLTLIRDYKKPLNISSQKLISKNNLFINLLIY